MLPKAPVVLFLVCCVAAGAAAYEKYTPNEAVRRYHYTEFEATADYGTQIAIERGVPVLAVGVLFITVLMIWGCCRCCCGKGKLRMRESGDCCQFVCGLLVLGLTVAALSLVIVGLEADKKQKETGESLVAVVDDMVDLIEGLTNDADDISTLTSTGLGIVANMTADDASDDEIDDTQLQALETALGTFNSSFAELSSNAQAGDVTNIRDNFSSQVSKYEDSRHLYFVIALAVLVVVVALQGAIAIFNWCMPCKPKRACLCRGTVPILTIVAVILTMILWILGTVMLVATTGASDFCIDADANLLEVANLDGQEIPTFFALCDEQNVTHPFRSEIDMVDSGLTSAFGLTANITIDLESDPDCQSGGANEATCDKHLANLAKLNTTLNDVRDILGRDLDNDGVYDTGVLEEVECSGLNQRYQSIVITTCDDMVGVIARLTEIFLAFAVIFLMMQFMAPLLSDTGSKQKKVQPMQTQGQLEMKKGSRRASATVVSFGDDHV